MSASKECAGYVGIWSKKEPDRDGFRKTKRYAGFYFVFFVSGSSPIRHSPAATTLADSTPLVGWVSIFGLAYDRRQRRRRKEKNKINKRKM
jgi:hypothetical protein